MHSKKNGFCFLPQLHPACFRNPKLGYSFASLAQNHNTLLPKNIWQIFFSSPIFNLGSMLGCRENSFCFSLTWPCALLLVPTTVTFDLSSPAFSYVPNMTLLVPRAYMTPTYPLWQNIDHELRVIGTWCWNLSYKLSHVICKLRKLDRISWRAKSCFGKCYETNICTYVLQDRQTGYLIKTQASPSSCPEENLGWCKSNLDETRIINLYQSSQ